MYKKTALLGLSVSACVALVAAQNEVTIYDLSIGPSPTSGGSGLADQISDVLNAVYLAGGEIKASAVAVDPAGATYYVAVQQVSAIPTVFGGRLTTTILPTPSAATFTFRADASRVYQAAATTTAVNGVKGDIEVEVECTHDVDSDTPVEEGVIICKQKLAVKAEAEGQKLATTFLATTTGKPLAALTVTNPANLTLPTGDPGANGAGFELRVGLMRMGMAAAAVAILSQYV